MTLKEVQFLQVDINYSDSINVEKKNCRSLER